MVAEETKDRILRANNAAEVIDLLSIVFSALDELKTSTHKILQFCERLEMLLRAAKEKHNGDKKKTENIATAITLIGIHKSNLISDARDNHV
jgi:hypothetical protein